MLSLSVLLFASCKKDSGNTSTSQAPHTTNIGDIAYGGIIFYLDTSGKHGMVCATTDQITLAVWDASINATENNPTPTGATGTEIGTGAANTTQIIAVLGSNAVAASLCRNYRGGGYSDWFLPSLWELNTLFNRRYVVGGSAFGGITSYWSSSENRDNPTAWEQDFNGSGYQYDFSKYRKLYVRAVRAF